MRLNHSILLVIIGLQLLKGHSSSAQKMMKIDEQLKARSQAMSVERKGGGTMIKYEFGAYKMISGKVGREHPTIRGPLFGSSRTLNDSTRMSFTLINKVADTCTADIRKVNNVTTDIGNLFSRLFLNWQDVEIMKGEGIFEAVFTFSSDTQVWQLVLVYPLAVEVDEDIKTDNKTKFRGLMGHTETTIEVRQVIKREGKEISVFNPVVGYEFWQDSSSLAALQVRPKQYVWIRNDLDATLKFVLANAATALLIFTEHYVDSIIVEEAVQH